MLDDTKNEFHVNYAEQKSPGGWKLYCKVRVFQVFIVSRYTHPVYVEFPVAN